MNIMKRNPEKKNNFIAAVLCGALLSAMVLSGCGGKRYSAEVQAGVDYLTHLEERDPGEVEATLKEIHRQNLLDQREERLAQLESGELSVWSLFEDYVILGDSRTYGLVFMDVLDSNRIFAEYGDTIAQIEDHLEEVDKYNPSYIIIAYGLNDIVQDGWETPELYEAAYEEMLRGLHERYPDAKIYTNSIFPCVSPGLERWDKWKETKEYSAAIEEASKAAGAYYIANEEFLDSIPLEYYNDDGLHFTPEFNQMWGTNIIMTIYDSEIGLSDSGEDLTEAEETEAAEEEQAEEDTL